MREIRGVGEGLANILIFKIQEVVEQVLNGSAGRERLGDHANGDAHASDAWLSAHDFGIGGYPSELLRVVRIALNSALKSGWNTASGFERHCLEQIQ